MKAVMAGNPSYSNLRAKADAMKADNKEASDKMASRDVGTQVNNRDKPDAPHSDQAAASALSSGGPKSAPVPVHDSMTSNSTHNDQGHAWGSPAALKDFSNRYSPKGFASGKKEINRAKLSERRQAFLNG
jgi:hypothetical protein